MKSITIISSSKRGLSSSKAIALKIKEGAEIKNKVNFIDLADFNLEFCNGCLICQKVKDCVINDDMKKVLTQISKSEILIFVSPIYFYALSGQMKTFLDRLNPLYIRKNKFKEVYLVTTSQDDSYESIEGPVKEINGFIQCFDGVVLKDTFPVLGVNSYDDLLKTDYLKRAEEFGKSL